MMAKKIVVGIGEALFDVFSTGRKIGGAPANFAYHASQLGCRGVAVSCVGRDALGDEVDEIFTSKGLEHLLQRSDSPTGIVNVDLDSKGVPTYEIKCDVAWDCIDFDDSLRALAADTDCVCFGSLAQRSPRSRKAIREFVKAMPEGAIKVFDINIRLNFYSRELIEESLEACNILKINDEEIALLADMFGIEGDFEAVATELIKRFKLNALILTCGAVGSYAFTATGDKSYIPTPKVTVADTVGAGDSFTAAFIASILRGKSVADAHSCAVRTSAFVCTKKGAMPILPADITA